MLLPSQSIRFGFIRETPLIYLLTLQAHMDFFVYSLDDGCFQAYVPKIFIYKILYKNHLRTSTEFHGDITRGVLQSLPATWDPLLTKFKNYSDNMSVSQRIISFR